MSDTQFVTGVVKCIEVLKLGIVLKYLMYNNTTGKKSTP